MAMIVSDLFEFDLFPDFRLVGGAEGLGREVRTVLVFDAPDIGYWIRGGEFLLSNGYVFKDDPEKFIRFMDDLAERNVAAIGVKFGRFLSTEVMKDVHHEADRIGLPVIHMPFHYDWTDIYERILPQLNPTQRKQVSEAAGSLSVDEDSNLDDLLSGLSSALERDIAFASRKQSLNLFFSYPFPFADPRKGRLFARVKSEEESPFPKIGSLSVSNVKRVYEGQAWWACYSTGSTPFFELCVPAERATDRLSESEEQLVIRAMAILRVLLTEDLLRAERSGDEMESMVEQIILGAHIDVKDAEKTSRQWGGDLAFPCRVALCHGPEAEQAFPLWRDGFDHLACRLGDLLVGIVPEKRAGLVDLAPAIAGHTMILGPLAGDTSEISGSFNRAKEALFWLKNRGAAPGVYRHESIIVDREIEAFARQDGAQAIWARYWRPLYDHAQKQAVPLKDFARELIRSNFNLRGCSRNLAIHYNTGRNYLVALEELLNLSLENEHDRFGLILAARIDAFRQEYH